MAAQLTKDSFKDIAFKKLLHIHGSLDFLFNAGLHNESDLLTIYVSPAPISSSNEENPEHVPETEQKYTSHVHGAAFLLLQIRFTSGNIG